MTLGAPFPHCQALRFVWRIMSTETEEAWAAGLFDGEGSTCIAGRIRTDGHRPSLRMTLSQKNTGPELLERFFSAVGYWGKVKERPDRPGVWTWSCTGEPCKKVLKVLWPYLSTPKRKQADLVLRQQIEARLTSPQKGGRSWPNVKVS